MQLHYYITLQLMKLHETESVICRGFPTYHNTSPINTEICNYIQDTVLNFKANQ